MRPDPPIPPGGGCAQCGQPRRPERSAKYAKDAAMRDPFCSRDCAEEWHGVAVDRERTTRDYGCISCGGPLDEVSPGCRKCERRMAKREARAA